MSELYVPSAMTRRGWLSRGAAAVAAAPLATATASRAAEGDGASRRVARLAHLTDIHVQHELEATAGMAACLHHLQGLDDPPELVVTGGDSVFDVFAADQARSDQLSALWRDTLRNECSLPVRSVIGNHDIRPWASADPAGADAKAWAQELLALERRYYGFDLGPWRILVLDSVQPHGDGYTGRLDPEQRQWLEEELQQLAGARPAMLISHIPILTLTTLIADQKRLVDGEHRVPGSWMLEDGTSLHYMLREHPNVKLCLSGHMHLLDRCELDGVTYLCGGAVSANWWKGRRQKMDEGYGLLDLYDDGRFEYAYTTFGWQAAPA
ncbi:MAG TPA: metallophosphoesterase [Lacipirellulaceae bacterium]|nr:metallophosphoesterase [Lacipirellulaceae bacterium]